ncbi:hypothetical protein DSO57_1000621 [Entomophthora muscae]|uniref:Uncharacterized protein n=1 Tax=Entomophthora muscae TaxID=34485 RepID=A0ACC2S0I1_9FUNG|nr:hypothetical protein DSO57_1000621 [Entomophthora muscae]
MIEEYPQQTLWALVRTSASDEEKCGKQYFDLLSQFTGNVSILNIVEDIKILSKALYIIANFPITGGPDIENQERQLGLIIETLTFSKPISIIMPIRAALSFSLPSTSSSEDLSNFTPF